MPACAAGCSATVERARGQPVERVVDERGLAGAGHAGHAGEQPERERDVDALQVVAARLSQPAACCFGSRARRLSGHLDALAAGEVLAGQRRRARLDLRGRALRDDLAAVHAGAGPEVDDVVGLADRLLVVLDDDHRVAEVAQAMQRVEQALVVALVQADRGLVEDVHDADQARADLAREPDALGFAAGQRFGAAVERQVVEADVHQEAEPVGDFLDDLGRRSSPRQPSSFSSAKNSSPRRTGMRRDRRQRACRRRTRSARTWSGARRRTPGSGACRDSCASSSRTAMDSVS